MKTTAIILLFVLIVVGCETANWLYYQADPIIKTNLALNAVNGSATDVVASRVYAKDGQALVRGGLFVVYIAVGVILLSVSTTKTKNETCPHCK